MADRISSENPSVHTIRASLEATATGSRVSIPTDEESHLPVDDVVRVVCDGAERFARIERPLDSETLAIPAVYASPRHARDPGTGEDRLAVWVDANGIRGGGSVLVDVIEAEFLYGLRAPGETAVYEAKEPPSDSLASIAEDLDG